MCLADDVVVRVGLLVQVELLVVITPVIQRIVEMENGARVLVVGHTQISVVSDSTLLPPVDVPTDIGVVHVVILATLLPEPDDIPNDDSRLDERLIVGELGSLLGLLHKSDNHLASILIAGIRNLLAGSRDPNPDQLNTSCVLLGGGAVINLDAHDIVVLLQLSLTVLG